MIKISKLCDYGIVIVKNLDNISFKSGADLIQKTGLPQATFNKLMNLLIKSNIVESRKGKLGGFRLFKKQSSITLLEVVEAIDGKIRIVECSLEREYPCGDQTCKIKDCEIKQGMIQLNKEFIKILESKTLDKFN